MTLLLRPATPGDHDAIAEIWHTAASLPTVGPATMPTLPALRARVDVEMSSGWAVTVATRGEVITGFLALKPADRVLDQLFVRPDERGGGIGRALLGHARAVMPQGFTLYTRAGNDRARRFYERAGLVVLREALHPRNHDPIVYYAWMPEI